MMAVCLMVGMWQRVVAGTVMAAQVAMTVHAPRARWQMLRCSYPYVREEGASVNLENCKKGSHTKAHTTMNGSQEATDHSCCGANGKQRRAGEEVNRKYSCLV
ncbi:hypothetical protein C8F01DRAFT_1097940 [Mycena amicta]|nr:hypothetical protein C8F01DRAFT_1097940 [Mycena amicta]